MKIFNTVLFTRGTAQIDREAADELNVADPPLEVVEKIFAHFKQNSPREDEQEEQEEEETKEEEE